MHRLIWILPCGFALVIAFLSHQPRLPFGASLPAPWDKVAHLTAYAVLAWSLDLALRRTRHDLPIYRRHLAVFLAVALFGLTDELHQAFIPGREPSGWDLVADACGAVLGLAVGSQGALVGRRGLADASWWRGDRERPDAKRPLILVADAHWQEDLTGLREATRQHPEADWLFLGDLFDVWVGLPGMEREAQRAFLWWVDERRQAGRWVGLWLGNREYFLDGHAARFSLMGEGVGGCLPSELLAWEHGDLVNAADRRYRLWNLVSRSGFLWLVGRLLPKGTAQALANRLERVLRTTNRAYKVAFPEAAFREAAADWGGRWTFVTGHFHTHHVQGRAVALPWAHEGAFWVWREGRLEPLSSC